MQKVIALSFFSLLISTSAIVVQNYSIAEAPPSSAGPSLDWSYVYHYNGSSAVAVGGSWLLTAAHVADDGNGPVSADGITYYPQETVYHNETDLALVRFDKAFPGFYPLYIDDLLLNPKLTVVLVGYGATGSVFDAGWTDDENGRGTRRWGTQEINATATDGFWMSFGLGDTVYEAGTGVGDSGGGVFYDDDGAWKVAGIITKRVKIDELYKSTFAIGMSDYADWIASTIPEPAMIHMMGLGTFGLFLARARKRKETVAFNTYLYGRIYACDCFFKDSPTRRTVRFFLYQQGLLFQELFKEYVEPVQNKAAECCRKWTKAFWDRMVIAHEQRMIRRISIRVALRKKALGVLDTFLAYVMR